MKLALYQGPSPAGDVDEALQRVDTMLAAAAAAGAGMAVFPELFLPGYNQPDLQRALAQQAGGAWEDRLAGLCRAHGCGLAIGWAERDGDRLYNTASCLDAGGTTLARYRKIQLFGPVEQATFAPGAAYVTFALGRYRAALLICYDVEFAHHVSALADLGVEVLLVPTANPAGFDAVPDFLVPARAAEARMIIAYANLCGHEAGLDYGGRSLIAGPDGVALALAGRGETLLVADLAQCDGLDKARLSTQAADRRVI